MAGWRGVEQIWRGLLAAVLLSGPALAAQEPVEEAQPASPEVPVVASTDAPAQEKKKKKAKVDPLGESPEAAEAPAAEAVEERSVRVFGRVFARASADEREDYTRSLSVQSARVG
ncbi:MAG TPA: hypothetical protein VD972_42330, partial [Hyalangium sp.]|nr:hypothetical protein [Hyalangium sp.]